MHDYDSFVSLRFEETMGCLEVGWESQENGFFLSTPKVEHS